MSTLQQAAATPTWRRRHGTTLLIAGAFVLAVVVALVVGGNDRRTAWLDPENPAPDGAQAVARVLADEGVDVSVVRSADAFDDTELDARTVVVVTSTEELGQNTVDRLVDHARGSRIVLVEPGIAVLAAWELDVDVSHTATNDGVAADCDSPRFAGLTLRVDDVLVYDDGEAGCFVAKRGSVLRELPDVTLFGGGEAMSNDQILRGDNAALSLRLLGQGDRVVWYVPQFVDVDLDAEIGLQALLPRWIRPGFWMLVVASIFLVVWRARRLGRLSTEPLPAVVKAIETTHSRGRLYRKAKDRAHAAEALRKAERERMSQRLGLGAGRDEDALVHAIARHVDRPVPEIAALIGTRAAPPTTDRELIELARDLTQLDREVRRT